MPRKYRLLHGYKFKVFLDTEDRKKIFPSISGIYIICKVSNNVRCIEYIGCTKNFNNRIYTHNELRHLRVNLEKPDYLEILFCHVDGGLTPIESVFVNLLQPRLNKCQGYNNTKSKRNRKTKILLH